MYCIHVRYYRKSCNRRPRLLLVQLRQTPGLYLRQCCDREIKISRLECTRVHFAQVSVLISRSQCQGLDLGAMVSVYFHGAAVCYFSKWVHTMVNMYNILPRIWELEMFQRGKVTFAVTQGHRCWCHLAVLWSGDQGPHTLECTRVYSDLRRNDTIWTV